MKKIMKKSVALLVGTLALAAVAGTAQAATMFAVQNASAVDKMVVTDTGYIGVGNANPLYPMHIVSAGPTSTTTIEFNNQGNSTYNSSDSPAFQLMRNNSATAIGGNGSTIPQHLDRLGNYAFGSYFGTSPKYAAGFAAYAQGTWTPTSYPGFLTFMTTGATDVYPQERMRINSSGNIGIGVGNASQKLEVNGGVRLNTVTVKPVTCTAALRGTIWFTQGVTGVGATADTLEVCAKDASDVYAWKALF